MASIGVGGGSGRATNHELPLVPFIDFLLCLVAFLLVTAVWAAMARLSATTQQPGREGDPHPGQPPKMLHVELREQSFRLSWRTGATVLASSDVPRPARSDERDLRYPELAARIQAEWQAAGAHRNASDPAPDQAVLHAQYSAQYAEMVAVLDALHSVQRPFPGQARAPAFDVSFAAD
jgi:biopolymer transport protein ExbD